LKGWELGVIETMACKICGAPSHETFRIPASKKTGHPIPDLPDDCPYYECSKCGFCFSTLLDSADHTTIYDESYWTGQDPDWYGRVSETLRLVLLANGLVQRPPDSLEILDFGCGMGTFVETCRRNLQLDAWGTDIIKPKFGADYFLPNVNRKFDIIVACEVMEHIPTPSETFRAIRGMLKPGGAFAFQTAEYDRVSGRNWWYVGPDNGHISLYSRGALDSLFKQLGGRTRAMWRDYPGVQAWQFEQPQLNAEEGRYRALEEKLAAVHRSTSWRVTAPLRGVGNIFRRTTDMALSPARLLWRRSEPRLADAATRG
jgi:SAM-dependent methyltransferase